MAEGNHETGMPALVRSIPSWDTVKRGVSQIFLDGPAPSSLLALVPKWSLLACLEKTLIFLCTEAWPQYTLGDQEKWPSEGSLNYNTILQLDLFCKREEKWTEVPYIQLFFYLWDHPEWLHNCYLDTQKLAVLCKP
jgi:hypothetical protein